MIEDWWNRFLKSSFITSLVKFAKRIKPWGFRGLSLFFVMKFFVEGLQKGALTTRSAAISFKFFLAFFPGLIILLTLIPLIPIDDFQTNLFVTIESLFPGETFDFFEETLDEIINKSNTALLSVGFVLLMYYASNSINAILIGFNSSYNLQNRGNWFVMRLASFGLMIVLGVFMISAIVLIMFSNIAFEHLTAKGYIESDWIIFMLAVIKWLVTVFLIYISVSTLYNVGNKDLKGWRLFSAGASFATLFYVISSIVFAYFVTNFAQYNKLYGSIGTLMVFLIWINFTSTIVLLGFELNTSITRAELDKRKIEE